MPDFPDIPALLVSVKPESCEKIMNGSKTLEIQKFFPLMCIGVIPPLFKVYMYCSQEKDLYRIRNDKTISDMGVPAESVVTMNRKYSLIGDVRLTGSVFGEFTCTDIIGFGVPCPAYKQEFINSHRMIIARSCLNYEQLRSYAGDNNWLYGFVIQNAKLFDRPLSLSELLLYEKNTPLLTVPQECCYVCPLVMNEK